VKPFCECTYRSLARSGAMRSRQSLTDLYRELQPYHRTHNVNDLPPFVQNAILGCLQDLPDNDIHARLPILPFPSLHHSAPAPPPPTR